ncbi:MAG: hypothetical protein AB1467_06350 [Candidatus Diapherotrites archaeon]
MKKMKNTVAVIIPTIGRKYVIETLPATIKNAALSLKRIGIKPSFIIEDTSENGLNDKVRRRLKATGERITLERAQNLGLNDAIDRGFELAERNNVFAMLSCCDDFLYSSKQLDRLIKPVLKREAEFVTAGWAFRHRNILSFPKPQYLNEIWVSRFASYANPAFEPSKFKANPFLSNPFSFQTFSGMICLTPQAHNKINSFIKEIFKNSRKEIKDSLGMWGKEPIRPVVALALGLKFKCIAIPNRRFEHEKPAIQTIQKHVESRMKQFNDSVKVIREFMVRTGQTRKLEEFNKMSEVVSTRIKSMAKSSPRRITYHRRKGAILRRLKHWG